MFGFLLLRGDKLHPEAFMEEKNEAMMVREPWLEIINKQGNQNPRMLTIIKPSVRLTQSDNVRARFNSNNRHSLRYYRRFFDKFFTQYPNKEKRSSENLILGFQTTFCRESESFRSYSGLTLNQYGVASP